MGMQMCIRDSGVFGERIEDGGRDEIGILAEVFSDMSLMVKHLIKDISEKELIRKAAELNLRCV